MVPVKSDFSPGAKGHNCIMGESNHVTQTSTMMALIRYRRKRVCVVLLIACLLWLMYLLTLLPSKGNPVPNELNKVKQETSPSRTYFTAPFKPPPKVEPDKNVIDAPHVADPEKDTGVKEPEKDSAVVQEQLHRPDISNSDKIKDNHENNDAKVVEQQQKEKTEGKEKDGGLADLGNMIKDKGYEIGVKLKNKTLEVGQKVKNKTLEQLAVISGDSSKNLPQLVFVPAKWNLSVSFEDIGDLLKETQFLHKVDPLNLNGPILVSSRNRTANYTYAMPVKFGYCDCFERYCVCCSQMTNKRLHLNSTACSNFTFMSKTHELDLQLLLDGKPIHRSSISADKSPLLCVGSVPKVADICVHFFNMTFKVNEHNAHQTQLLGCTDFSLNLYNRTIGSFPVDCFQIPGDPNQVHKERKWNNMFNWVP